MDNYDPGAIGQDMGMGMRGVPIGQQGPSKVFYALAVLTLLAGIILFVMFLYNGISGISEKLIQVVVPGTRELDLAPGSYTIFHEYQSVVDNRTYMNAPGVGNMEINLVNKDTQEQIALNNTTSNSNYNFGGRSGYGILAFKLDNPGTYLFSAKYDEGREGPETVLALSAGFLENLLMTIFGCLGILFGSITVSVMIFLWVFIKRKKAGEMQKKMMAGMGY